MSDYQLDTGEAYDQAEEQLRQLLIAGQEGEVEQTELEQVLNITTDGIAFQGFNVDEIKELESTVTNMVGLLNNKKKVGF